MEIKMVVGGETDPDAENDRLKCQKEKDDDPMLVRDSSGNGCHSGSKAGPSVQKKQKNFFFPILRMLGLKKTEQNNPRNECTTREIGLLIIIGLLAIALIISLTGFTIMWFTEVYNNTFISKLILANNSIAAQWWMNPPLSPHLKVHVFNYTNTERFLMGLDDQLHVEELGPYTYAENSTKVNVVFNENKTITYNEHRWFRFLPDQSGGKQYDQVTIPNIPLLAALSKFKYKGIMSEVALSLGIIKTNSQPFTAVSVDSLLWGYKDPLLELSKKFDTENSIEKFGLFVNRNGTGKDTLQIHTGEDDLRKLGVISEFNGQKLLNIWGTDECNRVDGTDGSQFPPHLMDKKKKLYVYINAMCRKLPLVYDSEVNLFDGVPAWRYKTPIDVFSHPDINPENQCFCDLATGKCPQSGIINTTSCYNAPIYISFPHLLSADEKIYKHIKGLHPDINRHQSFADVHPRLAFPIDGASRLQINVEVNKMDTILINEMQYLQDGSILPVIWLEVTSGELNDELRAMIYHSSFSANAIQLALRYGTLLATITTIALLVAICYWRGRLNDDDEIDRELQNLRKHSITKTTIQTHSDSNSH